MMVQYIHWKIFMKWCVNLRLGSEQKCGVLMSYRKLQARYVVNFV